MQGTLLDSHSMGTSEHFTDRGDADNVGAGAEITVCSANIVSALAFFSLSVHIGTLDFLTAYLRRHYNVKGCRVAAMLLTMILIVFILVMQLSATWWHEDKESELFLVCAFCDFSLSGVPFSSTLTRLHAIAVILWTHYDRTAYAPFDLVTPPARKRLGTCLERKLRTIMRISTKAATGTHHPMT